MKIDEFTLFESCISQSWFIIVSRLFLDFIKIVFLVYIAAQCVHNTDEIYSQGFNINYLIFKLLILNFKLKIKNLY